MSDSEQQTHIQSNTIFTYDDKTIRLDDIALQSMLTDYATKSSLSDYVKLNVDNNVIINSSKTSWPTFGIIAPKLQTGATTISCGIGHNIDENLKIFYYKAADNTTAYGALTMAGRSDIIQFSNDSISLRREATCDGLTCNSIACNASITTKQFNLIDPTLASGAFIEGRIGMSTGNTNTGVFGYANDDEPYAYFGAFGLRHIRLFDKYNTYIRGNLSVSGTVTQNASTTITHYCPIEDDNDLTSYEVGEPVFMTGHVYKYVDDAFVQSTVDDSTDCICSVKPSGIWKEFVGIVTSIDEDAKCLKFATHGDYIFHVTDSSKYEIGDMICYDGSVISDDDIPTFKLMISNVGRVTAIIDDEHIAVFKE